MKVKKWVGLATTTLLLSLSCSQAFAEAPVETGQPAAPIRVAEPIVTSNQPIRLSAVGEAPASTVKPVAVTSTQPIQLSPVGESPMHVVSPIAKVNDSSDRRTTLLWKISIATMLASTALDAGSSMGKHEANPLLRSSNGTFGSRGIAIKAGLAGFTLVPQIALRNRHDLRKAFTIANFIDTGIFTAVSAHNMGIKAAAH
jgi:hypothetical protein